MTLRLPKTRAGWVVFVVIIGAMIAVLFGAGCDDAEDDDGHGWWDCYAGRGMECVDGVVWQCMGGYDGTWEPTIECEAGCIEYCDTRWYDLVEIEVVLAVCSDQIEGIEEEIKNTSCLTR